MNHAVDVTPDSESHAVTVFLVLYMYFTSIGKIEYVNRGMRERADNFYYA